MGPDRAHPHRFRREGPVRLSSRNAAWGGMLATASMAGFLRYRAGMHYPTAVIAGALTGSLSGFLAPFLHRAHDTDITVLPFTGGQTGISISLRL